jgi:hypothetical protein
LRERDDTLDDTATLVRVRQTEGEGGRKSETV